MICKELNKEFTNKRELFDELKANKELLIKEKKSQVYKSYEKGLGVSLKPLKINTIKGLEMDSEYHYIAVNTTNILDSHGDLHVKGIWNKSVKEQQGRNYLVTDHKMELSNVVARKEDVEMIIADVNYSSIGKSYEGETQALIYKISKEKVINSLAKEWLESGNDIEASVRMQYVNVDLALNSDANTDKAEKALYDQHYDTIANKKDFDSIDYFWVVKEAKNVGESSLVLAGSNGVTGPINNSNVNNIKNTEPEPTTQGQKPFEPVNGATRENKSLSIYNLI